MNGCDPAWLEEMRMTLYAGILACVLLLVILNWPEKADDSAADK